LKRSRGVFPASLLQIVLLRIVMTISYREGKMKLVERAGNIFDRLIRIMMLLSAALMILLMLMLCYGVVMRYIFHSPVLWVPEISQYSLIYITVLPAAWLLSKEKHITIDFIYDLLNPRAQYLLEIFVSIICALLFLGLTIYGSWITIDHAQRGIFPAMSVLRIPDTYMLIIIPIFSFLLFLQYLRRTSSFVRKWIETKGQQLKGGEFHWSGG
jgi:TRAP-type C4-dicarboxylate transport system permease small subunit